MIYRLKRFLIILFFFSVSFVSFGEDPDPLVPPAPPECPDVPVPSPIEDGVPVVLGLALIYGAFKLQQARRKIRETEKEA